MCAAKKQNWNPEVLKELIKESGYTHAHLANALGISVSKLASWMNGTQPTLRQIATLADIFGVPMEYICGFCSKEESEEIQKDYKNYFLQRKRKVFLDYISGHRRDEIKDDGRVEAVWPYNLLDNLLRNELWGEPLTPRQERGLQEALSTLTERERDMLYKYYHDEMTLGQIGEEYHLCRDRIRQIIAKACRKLRHPRRFNLIKNGYDPAEHEPTVEEYADRVKKYIKELQQREAELQQYEMALQQQNLELQALEQKIADKAKQLEAVTNIGLTWSSQKTSQSATNVVQAFAHAYEMLIEEMDLSVRSYNCLKRAGLNTVGDVIAHADKLLSIRNMGQKSKDEVVKEVYEYTGIRIAPDAEIEPQAKAQVSSAMPIQTAEERLPKPSETPSINGIPVPAIEAALANIKQNER